MKSIKKTPTIFSFLSLIAFFAFAKQEKVLQIFRNGEVIQEYAVNDIDYIEVNDLIPAPDDVNASVSNDQITIKWNPVEGATYNIYRSPDNVNFTLHASKLTETTYTDTKPLRGSNFYRVTAVVGDVESGYSSSAAATLTSSELDNGIYLGITGFNQALYEYLVLQLTESSVDGFRNFVDGLNMKNGTILYYSVDQALNTMQATELPSDITTAAIVTFTDGLDQGSFMMDGVSYNDEMEYLNALNHRIKNETVSGQPITAYSIGIRGKDVSDINMFRTNLAKLASSTDNATEVTSMAEVNAKFKEIAEQLSKSNYIQTINLKMPGLSNGTRVRFTFDNVNAANKSKIYIEGKFNLKDKSLEEVQYVGLTSTSGTTVKGTVDGIFVNFTFDGVHTDNNVLINSESTDEWTYIASNNTWQINSEFDKTENSDIVTERSSAVIMLVLDCSSSLADDFVKAQSNAKDFINTLYGAVTSDPSFGNNTSHYTRDQLIAKGFRFQDRNNRCSIKGINGPATIDCFVGNEGGGYDNYGYSDQKLSSSYYYSGEPIDGLLDGVVVMYANGPQKILPSYYIGYFCEGHVAYPLMEIYTDGGNNALCVQEVRYSYAIYHSVWSNPWSQRPMINELIKIYGEQITQASFIDKGVVGEFDIESLTDAFNDFMKGNNVLSSSAWEDNK